MPLKLTAAVLAVMTAATSAGAEIRPVPTKMFCGYLAEIRKVLPNERVMLRGPSGSATPSVGEVWMNPATGAWTFLQVLNDGRTACVMLGGRGGLVPVNGKTEGDPS